MNKYNFKRLTNEDLEKNNKSNILDNIFNKIGFEVSNNGIITPTNSFSKIICKLGVKDGVFDDLKDGTYKLLK